MADERSEIPDLAVLVVAKVDDGRLRKLQDSTAAEVDALLPSILGRALEREL